MKKFKVSIINGYEDFINTDNLWLTIGDNKKDLKVYKAFNKNELLICLTCDCSVFNEICKVPEKLSDLFIMLSNRKSGISLLYINMEEKSVNTLLMPDIFFFLAGRNDRSIRLLENNSHGTNIDNDDLLIVLKGCIKDIRTEFLANIIMRNKSISYPMIKSISSAFRINKINASPILILDYTLHRSYEFPIKSSLKAINLAVNMIRNKVVQYNSDKIWKIETVLQEALVNAVTYGNGLNSARPLQMNYEIGEKGLRVFIKDSGKGFDVFNTSVPIGREALEKISGRGIYIMKKFSDAIFYNRQGNEVIMFFSFV